VVGAKVEQSGRSEQPTCTFDMHTDTDTDTDTGTGTDTAATTNLVIPVVHQYLISNIVLGSGVSDDNDNVAGLKTSSLPATTTTVSSLHLPP